jgi:hypothetical protein
MPEVLPEEQVEQFLQDLAADNTSYYANTPPELKTYWPHRLVGDAAIEALSTRWFNEYIGTIVLARLLEKVEHPKLKMLVGRQAGDEAKHAQVCEKRVRQLGGRIESYDPLPEQLHLYDVLDTVEYPEEFLAAMQFTTEHEGVKRNEQALDRFDAETAQMFADAINPDEPFHVQLGWIGLRILCVTPEAQERARRACHRQRELHADWTAAYRVRMEERGLL